MRNGLRVIAMITLGCFLTTQCVSGSPAAGIQITGGRELPAYLSLDVPAELGSLDALYEAPASSNPQFILHIQNAHANYDAQMKIKQLLGYMNKKYGFKTIFVEGAVEKLDADYLRLFPDEARNRKLCDDLAKEGQLTGAELFLMEQGTDNRPETIGQRRATASSLKSEGVEALGIEQAALYRSNYEALKKVFGAEADVQSFFAGFDSKLDRTASQVFTSEARQMIADWKRFEQGRREFMPFVQELAKKSKKILNTDLETVFAQVGWPQISRLLAIQKLEKDLNKEKGLAEKAELIQRLRKKGASKELLATLENFNEGSFSIGKSAREVSPREVLEHLVQEAGPKGFKFSDYPAFSQFAGYVTLRAELDPKALFEEIEYLFTQMLDTLSVDSQQKTLLALYRDGELLRKLLHLELNRTDWQKLLERKERIAIPSMVARLKDAVQATDHGPQSAEQSKKSMDHELSTVDPQVMPTDFAKKMSGLFTAGLEFYDFAHQREGVFYKEMKSAMAEKKITRAILITGGFHTEGMSDLFRENAVSYGIVTPRLSEKSDENLYRNIMMHKNIGLFDVSYMDAVIKMQSLREKIRQGDIEEGADDVSLVMTKFAQGAGIVELADAVEAFLATAEGQRFLGDEFTIKMEGSDKCRLVPRSEVRTPLNAPQGIVAAENNTIEGKMPERGPSAGGMASRGGLFRGIAVAAAFVSGVWSAAAALVSDNGAGEVNQMTASESATAGDYDPSGLTKFPGKLAVGSGVGGIGKGTVGVSQPSSDVIHVEYNNLGPKQYSFVYLSYPNGDPIPMGDMLSLGCRTSKEGGKFKLEFKAGKEKVAFLVVPHNGWNTLSIPKSYFEKLKGPVREITFTIESGTMGKSGTVDIQVGGGLAYTPVLSGETYDEAKITPLPNNPILNPGTVAAATSNSVAYGALNLDQTSSRNFSLRYELPREGDYAYTYLGDGYFNEAHEWVGRTMDLSSGLTFAVKGPGGKQMKVEVLDKNGDRASFYLKLNGEKQNQVLDFQGLGIDPASVAQVFFVLEQKNMGPEGTVEIEMDGLNYIPVVQGDAFDAAKVTQLSNRPVLSPGYGSASTSEDVFSGAVRVVQSSGSEFRMEYSLPHQGDYGYAYMGEGYFDGTKWVGTTMDLSSGLTLAVAGPAGKLLKVEVVDQSGAFATYYLDLTGGEQNHTLNLQGMGIDALHVAQIVFVAERSRMGAHGSVAVKLGGVDYVPVVSGKPYDGTKITRLLNRPVLASGSGSVTSGTLLLSQSSASQFSGDYSLPGNDDYVFAYLGEGDFDAAGRWIGTTMDLRSGVTLAMNGPAGARVKMEVVDKNGLSMIYDLDLNGVKKNYSLDLQGAGIDESNIARIIFTLEHKNMGSSGQFSVEIDGLAYTPVIASPTTAQGKDFEGSRTLSPIEPAANTTVSEFTQAGPNGFSMSFDLTKGPWAAGMLQFSQPVDMSHSGVVVSVRSSQISFYSIEIHDAAGLSVSIPVTVVNGQILVTPEIIRAALSEDSKNTAFDLLKIAKLLLVVNESGARGAVEASFSLLEKQPLSPGATFVASNAGFSVQKIESPDGRSGTLRFMDLVEGRSVDMPYADEDLLAADVSPDGQTLVYVFHNRDTNQTVVSIHRTSDPTQSAALVLEGSFTGLSFEGILGVISLAPATYKDGSVIQKNYIFSGESLEFTELSADLLTEGSGFFRASPAPLAIHTANLTSLPAGTVVNVYVVTPGTTAMTLLRKIPLGEGQESSVVFQDIFTTPSGRQIVSLGYESADGTSHTIVMDALTGESVENWDGVANSAAVSVEYHGRYAIYTLQNGSQGMADLETLRPASTLSSDRWTVLPGSSVAYRQTLGRVQVMDLATGIVSDAPSSQNQGSPRSSSSFRTGLFYVMTPDGVREVYSSNEEGRLSVKVYDPKTMTWLGEGSSVEGRLVLSSVSADGQFLALVDVTGGVKVMSLSGEVFSGSVVIPEFKKGVISYIGSIAFVSPSRLLVTLDDGSGRSFFLNIKDGKLTLAKVDLKGWTVVPGSSLAYELNAGKIQVKDLSTGKVMTKPSSVGKNFAGTGLAYAGTSEGLKELFFVEKDGGAYVYSYDTRTGQWDVYAVPGMIAKGVWRLAPDGNAFAVANGVGKVTMIPLIGESPVVQVFEIPRHPTKHVDPVVTALNFVNLSALRINMKDGRVLYAGKDSEGVWMLSSVIKAAAQAASKSSVATVKKPAMAPGMKSAVTAPAVKTFSVAQTVSRLTSAEMNIGDTFVSVRGANVVLSGSFSVKGFSGPIDFWLRTDDDLAAGTAPFKNNVKIVSGMLLPSGENYEYLVEMPRAKGGRQEFIRPIADYVSAGANGAQAVMSPESASDLHALVATGKLVKEVLAEDGRLAVVTIKIKNRSESRRKAQPFVPSGQQETAADWLRDQRFAKDQMLTLIETSRSALKSMGINLKGATPELVVIVAVTEGIGRNDKSLPPLLIQLAKLVDEGTMVGLTKQLQAALPEVVLPISGDAGREVKIVMGIEDPEVFLNLLKLGKLLNPKMQFDTAVLYDSKRDRSRQTAEAAVKKIRDGFDVWADKMNRSAFKSQMKIKVFERAAQTEIQTFVDSFEKGGSAKGYIVTGSAEELNCLGDLSNILGLPVHEEGVESTAFQPGVRRVTTRAAQAVFGQAGLSSQALIELLKQQPDSGFDRKSSGLKITPDSIEGLDVNMTALLAALSAIEGSA